MMGIYLVTFACSVALKPSGAFILCCSLSMFEFKTTKKLARKVAQ